ncbi:hypothetical protein T459_26218 [Capsicum annuum]|uniref:SGNH hydrolase-type esterase domain-containing protein n=1 Tax=Capsicum annuum TaxID=4072 RepID=A0A2G2YN40_CAPAN|nr:hypothetical protein T459_26218 [Capsicum annuum]
MALEVYKKIFPKEHCWDSHKEIQPSLVILYFGGNDSQDPDFPNSSHGPLHEYVENMRKLAHHIKVCMKPEKILNTLTTLSMKVDSMGLSDKTRLIMLSAPAVKEEQILKTYGDGMHLTAEESKILFDKIKDVIKKADWEPTLDWDKMPTEYADIGTDILLEMMIKETEDETVGITDSEFQELKPQ